MDLNTNLWRGVARILTLRTKQMLNIFMIIWQHCRMSLMVAFHCGIPNTTLENTKINSLVRSHHNMN